MNESNHDLQSGHAEGSRPQVDEGGLRPPDHVRGWRRWWWWFDFIILVKLARLRFIAILVVIGIVITQWDLLLAYYARWTRPADTATVASDTEYYCPMHPAVVRDNNNEKCPVCFMPLAKRKKGVAQTEALPAGIVNRVQLSPYRVVLAGVETVTVEPIRLSRPITAIGTVDFNERGQKVVSARVKGRIDKLLVNETGKTVKQGQDLALLYSPDLAVTMDNLVQAHKRGDERLLGDVKERLRLLGVNDDQIDDAIRSGKAPTQLAIRSPIAGHIIQKFVKEGQYVEEGMALYEVVDLSTVWIQAQVYEDDMVMLPLGQSHELTAAEVEKILVSAETRTYPGEVFRGRLAFIYPHLDEGSRTVTVRFELENPQHKLRPGSTATVTITIPPEQVPLLAGLIQKAKATGTANDGTMLLAVPDGAVIDTGSQKIVYRQTEPGVFEGVEVKLGPKMKSDSGVTYYPVLGGLAEGDRIVTSGSFLVDAETRLNPAAGSIYFGGSSGAKDSGGAVTAVRSTTPDDPDAKIKAALAKLGAEDRKLAEAQRFCPILATSRLGSMGVPVKLTIKGQTVFVCCNGCRDQALKDGEKTVARVNELRAASGKLQPKSTTTDSTPKNDKEEREIATELAKLSPADRTLALEQRLCVVSDGRLGSMGVPVKIKVGGETVFLCCDGCQQAAEEDVKGTIAKLKQLRAKSPASQK